MRSNQVSDGRKVVKKPNMQQTKKGSRKRLNECQNSIVENMHRHRTCAEWRQGARSHNQQAARSSAHEELWQKKTMTSAKVTRSHASNHIMHNIFTTRKSAEATILNARRCWNTPRDRSWRYCWWNWLLWCYFLGLRMMAGNASGSLQECPAVYPLALPTHDNYEVGKILNPLDYLSIGGKLKFTDLIGWANVDGMGSDRMGWDRIGSDPVLRFSGPTTPTTTVTSIYE